MTTEVYRYAPAPGALDNPLKGWCPYPDTAIHLPYSMTFHYTSWRDLEPVEGDYRFAAWEKSWDASAAARGRHVSFRVYIDYPGLAPGLPDWLKAKGVKVMPYTAKDMPFYEPGKAKGESPDYENPVLVAALERLIAGLGKRYDTHGRVAFLQLGLLGFWGEWHTWPFDAMFAGEKTQERVVAAYKTAFPHKKLMARYANGATGKPTWLGYHDDAFPDDTDGKDDWQFLPGIRRAGRTENYRRAPVGGEMVPNEAGKWIGTTKGYVHTRAMVDAAHFSWVGPYCPAMDDHAKTDATFRARCESLVRRMGYQFRLTDAALPGTLASGSPFAMTLRGVNEGVAPFYYPWAVQIALLAGNDTPVATATLPGVDIRTWQPGKPFAATGAARFPAPVKTGRYRVAAGITDPWTNRPAVRLANRVPVTRDGWHVLGTVAVK